MASARVSAVPLPSASFCWIGMIVASGARPVKPVPFASRAAMMPATLVPWPTVSVVPSSLPRSSFRPSFVLRSFGIMLRPALASTAGVS